MVMVIIVSVILTALVLVVAQRAGNQAQMSSAVVRLDQANAAAESAGQIAVWQFKHNTQWSQATAPSPLPTLVIGNNTFSYSITTADASTSPAMYWPFSEGSGTTTKDVSGNSNTATLNAGVAWTTAGECGNALVFDGVNDYLSVPKSASNNIAGSITVATWIKLGSAAQDQKIIGNEDGPSSNYLNGYKLSVYGQKAEFECGGTTATNRYIAGGTILQLGVWYHIAGVYNSSAGTISTYVNGVLDRVVTGMGHNTLLASTAGVTIGRESWPTGGDMRYFCGTLDEVRAYARVLSAAEIMNLAVPSLHVHVVTAKTNGSTSAGSAVDFSCSVPPALAPTAPSLTVGSSLPMKYLSVSGDVQAGSASVSATSSINGHFTYGSTFTDPSQNLTVTYQGSTISPTQSSSLSVPTINYSNIASQSVWTTAGSSNQSVKFNHINYGVNVLVLTGNCTDPVIDTSATSGTLYITGNLTITKATTWASAGNPVYIVVKGSVIQSNTLNLSGCLYVGGNWTHTDCTINGIVCVAGSVIDNTTSATTITGGGIPWFDPRGSVSSTPVPLYYAHYQGATP